MQELLNRTNISSMTNQNVGSSIEKFICICFTIYCAIRDHTHSKLCDVQNLRSKQTRAENDS